MRKFFSNLWTSIKNDTAAAYDFLQLSGVLCLTAFSLYCIALSVSVGALASTFLFMLLVLLYVTLRFVGIAVNLMLDVMQHLQK